MVAPDYTAKRSALAKTIGVRRKSAPAAAERDVAKPAAGRGKGAKAAA
jgi:predicted transcriptional regulator